MIRVFGVDLFGFESEYLSENVEESHVVETALHHVVVSRKVLVVDSLGNRSGVIDVSVHLKEVLTVEFGHLVLVLEVVGQFQVFLDGSPKLARYLVV